MNSQLTLNASQNHHWNCFHRRGKVVGNDAQVLCFWWHSWSIFRWSTFQDQDRASISSVRSLLFNVGSSFSPTRLLSMEADGAPSSPLASVSAPFYGYSKLWLHGSGESRVTEDRTGDFSLRKPRTSQLSLDCSSTMFLTMFLTMWLLTSLYSFSGTWSYLLETKIAHFDGI